MPTETCSVVANIDNSFCEKPIKKVQIHLTQKIMLNDNGGGAVPYSYTGHDPFHDNSSSDEEYSYKGFDQAVGIMSGGRNFFTGERHV